MFCETTDQYLLSNIITCWSDGYTLRNLKLWVTEMICLLAGAEIRRVTNEFVRYSRIQLTQRTKIAPHTVVSGAVSPYSEPLTA